MGIGRRVFDRTRFSLAFALLQALSDLFGQALEVTNRH
jgi:hypothetical protein